MALLDRVPEHPSSAPTVIDWRKIKDGLKWKRIILARKAGYASRKKIDVQDDDIFLLQVLIDQLIGITREDAAKAAHETARQQLIAEQQSTAADVDGLDLEEL